MAAYGFEIDGGNKEIVEAVIREQEEALRGLSMSIHGKPELAMQEKHAHDTLCAFLEERGFKVERSYLGVETAFLATFEQFGEARESGESGGDDLPTVATLCEYDALPGIGHACGHNLIATAGAAAGLVAKGLLERGGKGTRGRVLVMGTPAEEALGGKCMLIERGAFRRVDACMMVHPSGFPDVVHCTTLAIAEMRVIFKGQTAHASALPWEGRNALDALVNLYTMIALNRQGMKPNMRVHGIVVDGGKAPNIIPDRAEGAFYLRAGDCADLEGLKAKTLNCIHAAALATGCEAEVVWEGANYLDLKTNPVLADLFTRVWSNPSLGTVQEQLAIPVGSTDMGNVCYAVPGIHPCYYIPCDKANHTVEFTHAAGSEEGLQRTLAVAKVMGHSLYLLLLNPSLLVEARKFYNYTGFDK